MRRSRKLVPLRRGDDATRRTRQALQERAAAVDLLAGVGSLPVCPEAARFWSERAWSELAAVPAMSQTALALVRDSADLDSLGAMMQIGADEVRHTELSRDVANGLGGYVELIPADAAWEPALLGEASSMPLPFWIVANGCISETLSLELLRARLAYAGQPTIHAVLSTIVKDEAVHQRIGWQLAARVLPDVSRAVKRELAGYARAMFELITKTFATTGLPPRSRREARRIREVTAAAGLGACPPDEADQLSHATVADHIVPRLRKLGIDL